MKGTMVFYNPKTDKIMLLEYNDIKKQHRIECETHTLISYYGMNSKNIIYMYRKLFKYIGDL
jgi:hypothetical protein